MEVMFGRLLCWTAAAATLVGGCRSTTEPTGATATVPATTTAAAAEAEADTAEDAERAACEASRRNVEQAAELPGAPELQSRRAHLLARAKGSPVVFLRPPRRDLDKLPAHIRALVRGIDDPRQALGVLQKLRAWLPNQPEMVRAVLLPEGYLYAESPEAAEWLELIFKLEHLFKEKELWLLRGSEVHRLVRGKFSYQFAEGPDKGRDASLLVFDRLALSPEALLPALHVDLVPASREAGFDRVDIQRLTSEGITARLRYGAEQTWTTAVLGAEQARARVVCEVPEQGAAASVAAFRREARERERIMVRLRAAIALQVDENLPFDEPREEVGQQDGSLRPQWAWTYRNGGLSYRFNDLPYMVFDHKGRPKVPQVCVDFVLDTFERASGTWYSGRGEERARVVGTIDFEPMQLPNRRGVESVVNFFRERPELFQVWDLPAEERIRYRERHAFLEYLRTRADEFRPPDVVVIHGPKGDENHYHSFIVYESDPVTGMPMLLAGNAGKPRVRPWSATMLSGPLRSIKNRLRPNQAWLARSLAPEGFGAVAQTNPEPVAAP
jgi:hypothetical protein